MLSPAAALRTASATSGKLPVLSSQLREKIRTSPFLCRCIWPGQKKRSLAVLHSHQALCKALRKLPAMIQKAFGSICNAYLCPDAIILVLCQEVLALQLLDGIPHSLRD